MNYAHWRDKFASAMDPRLFNIEHLDALVAADQVQTWFGKDSAIVTELRTYPTGAKVIHGLVAAGDLDEIMLLIKIAEEWAESIGCCMAIIESRPGWVRKLKASGYAIHQTAVRKDL
jgi:hypothetical protein